MRYCDRSFLAGEEGVKDMRYRKIKKSDLEVSAICVGTWAFGGDAWGEANDNESIRVIEEAIANGVNIVDTAPVYGGGRSESVLGRAIKGNREKVIIATKCGLEIKGASIRVDLTPAFIRKDLEGSLKRLGVDTVDVYQCHWPDPKTPAEVTFGEMKKLVDEGKIRYIGVSNFDKDMLEEALSVAPIVSNQVQYSLFDRTAEKELLSFCRENDVAILPYGALGGGILTGKYRQQPAFPKRDVRSFFYKFYHEPFWEKAQKIISVLEEIALSRKVSTVEVAINWMLSHEEVPSCIVGCRTAEQLKMNIAATEWEMSKEELERIEKEYNKIF